MITTTIRIDQIVYEKVVKKADNDLRSINAEINYILKAYLEMLNWNHLK